MVFSASSARSLLTGGGNGFYYLERTLVFGAIGLAVMRVASLRGVAVARTLTPLMVAVSLFLLVAVLAPGVGQTVNGAQRWMGRPAPVPAVRARQAHPRPLRRLPAREGAAARSLAGLGPYLLVAAGSILLVAIEPDLGTSMIIAAAVGCVLFVAGVRLRTLAPVAFAVGLIAVAVVASNPYQQERLTGFQTRAPTRAARASRASRRRSRSAREGSSESDWENVQKASYLPEAHTDMVAAVIGEELGLVGLFVLVGLFGMFGYAGLRAAHRARDRFSKLLAAGLTSLILAQAALNLFAVFGLAPLTGVPLPFVSYGGTSLVMTLASAGLILNVARRPAAQGAGRRTSGGTGRAGRGDPLPGRGPCGLGVVDGDHARVLRAKRGATRNGIRRARASGSSRDSGRRHGGRRAGDRRRRRASR